MGDFRRSIIALAVLGLCAGLASAQINTVAFNSPLAPNAPAVSRTPNVLVVSHMVLIDLATGKEAGTVEMNPRFMSCAPNANVSSTLECRDVAITKPLSGIQNSKVLTIQGGATTGFSTETALSGAKNAAAPNSIGSGSPVDACHVQLQFPALMTGNRASIRAPGTN